MTLLLVPLVLLPWSIWWRMHAHEITPGGLVKLPLIWAAASPGSVPVRLAGGGPGRTR